MNVRDFLRFDSSFTCSAKAEIDIPDIYSAELIMQHLSKGGNGILLVDAASGEELSVDDVRKAAIGIARALTGIGLQPGHVVYCMCCDTARYACAILGIQLAGLTYSGNYLMATTREAESQAGGLEAKAVICSLENLEVAMQVADNVPSLQIVIVLDKVAERTTNLGKRVVSMNDLVKSSEAFEDGEQWPRLPSLPSSQSPAYIMYSSGSTGLPKGCIITDRNDVARCLAIAQRQGSQRKVVSLTVGFPHTVGLMMLRVAIIKGNTLVIDNHLDLDLKRFLRNLEKYKCTSAWLGPSQVTSMSKQLDLMDGFDLISLNEIKTGGAVLSESVITAFTDKTRGAIKIRNVYGLTEVGDVTITPDGVDSCSVGSLVAGQYVRVVDRESGAPLPIGQVGEICVSGLQVSPGYLNRPEANLEHYTPDGWFSTGDMGYFNDSGLLYIIDRYKEVIKVFGEQVTPAELESVLLSHESVAEAAVVGIRDAIACEIPVAFVVLKEKGTMTLEQILAHANSQVADFKQIQGGIHVVDHLPKISIGKIDRKFMKQKASQLSSLSS